MTREASVTETECNEIRFAVPGTLPASVRNRPIGVAMALLVNTHNPSSLLQRIKVAIDDGTVRTWRYNAQGDFTHAAPQWKEQAWLRPTVLPGAIRFDVVLPSGTTKPGVEGVYQGRFNTMLQNHFHFTAVECSTPQQPPPRRGPAVGKRKRSRSAATGRTRSAQAQRGLAGRRK